jgi:prepilin-type processing-associated H-X9-DG protein
MDADDELQDLTPIRAIVPNATGPILPPDEGSAQVVQGMFHLVPYLPQFGGDPVAGAELVDSDLSVLEGLGNGGHGSEPGGPKIVYRLREGIERFLITDINDPAASAKAQSDIFVMGDAVATEVASYNHVPGGSNVLYMDGHVTFQKYDVKGPGPVNAPVARILGMILSAL